MTTHTLRAKCLGQLTCALATLVLLCGCGAGSIRSRAAPEAAGPARGSQAARAQALHEAPPPEAQGREGRELLEDADPAAPQLAELAADDNEEEIIVTGSRVKRSTYRLPSSIQMTTRERSSSRRRPSRAPRAPQATPRASARRPSAAARLRRPPLQYPRAQPAPRAERYHHVPEPGFRSVVRQPLSTFSVDVDTASYANVRRFLSRGQRPPETAVRVEELINYFDYAYPDPPSAEPIAIHTELARSPGGGERALLRVGLKAADTSLEEPPARNLVFLIDVSGSMSPHNKLPLLQQALGLLLEQLDERDSLAIVVYAGGSGVVLPPTAGNQHDRIARALAQLRAGGSTHGSAGIELAYDIALDQRRPGAVNRVILATDGDFNVGVTDRADLIRLIERRRRDGVFLTVLGFGMGNLNDATLEGLADHGNGNYAYIDTLSEAHKVLVTEASSTLRTVAKDTKVQVEMNPRWVSRYRLVGYDNRRLTARDFDDDRKDAGDMGDGDSVTALYELQLTPQARKGRLGSEVAYVKVRYKHPEQGRSVLIRHAVRRRLKPFAQASDDLRFSTAVAAFGSHLRNSPHVLGLDLEGVGAVAAEALGEDVHGYRRDFLSLLDRAQGLLTPAYALE